MTEPAPPVWSRMSRATRTIVVLGTVLIFLAITGIFRADRGLEISSDEAVDIARELVDFEAEAVQVRLVRQGIKLRPVWAVSLSIPGPNASQPLRLATVEIDAIEGRVLRTVASR